MVIDRKEAVAVLEEIALLLELKGENAFKIRAYENAARALSTMEIDFETFVRSGEIAKTKGFGKALVEKLIVLVETGTLPFLEELRAVFPASLLKLLQINGVGPKKVSLFYHKLGVTSVDELEAACKDGRIAGLSGMGKKTADNILASIERSRRFESFFHYYTARLTADQLLAALRDITGVQKIELAGSLRRFREVTKDIDILGVSEQPAAVMAAFTTLPLVAETLSRGRTKSSVVLTNGMQADLRLVAESEFANALQHFTGSKEHNVALRSRAQSRGMKVSEWGLFDVSNGGETLIPCDSEEAIYKKLGLCYVPPELRENLGEIECAETGVMPTLVTEADYRGVLHCHTFASDGANSVAELVAHARGAGHSFLAITDHSKSSFQANGLNEERILKQLEQIRDLQKDLKDFRLYAGVECDILLNGDLDLDDDVLKQLDIVIVSVHSGFSRNKRDMTERVVRAIEHPCSRVLAHPTGRLLLRREGYELDWDVVMAAAVANNVAIELNCNPLRLDMDWRLWRRARDQGVRCSLNPDAHRLSHFDFVRFGIGFCRKGWLTANDIVNCWSTDELNQFLGHP